MIPTADLRPPRFRHTLRASAPPHEPRQSTAQFMQHPLSSNLRKIRPMPFRPNSILSLHMHKPISPRNAFLHLSPPTSQKHSTIPSAYPTSTCASSPGVAIFAPTMGRVLYSEDAPRQPPGDVQTSSALPETVARPPAAETSRYRYNASCKSFPSAGPNCLRVAASLNVSPAVSP
jgi:hypothetical protein